MWMAILTHLVLINIGVATAAQAEASANSSSRKRPPADNLSLKLTDSLKGSTTLSKASFFGLTGAVATLAQALALSMPAHAAEPPIKLAKIDQSLQQATGSIPLKLSEWPATKSLDLTSQTDDLWQNIRRSFSIPDLNTKDVRSREKALIRHEKALKKILKGSEPYLHYIVQECARRGLPTELALLPFIESKFNPHAHSRARAAGLWQFIPSTGTHYELDQNDWVDERLDLIESTRAALDYLTYLYDMHGDWHLALISYNWGEGSVAKAVRKAESAGLEPTLEHLELPPETAAYVPKLQAYKNIIAYPEKFGITLPKIANKPYFTVLRHTRDIDFRELARLSSVNLGEFHKLNPALKQPVMYAARTQTFLIPARYEEKITNALAKYQPPKPYKVYRVRPGDTLGHIAARFDTTVRDIQTLNSLGRKTRIKPGMSLTLPNPIARTGWPT